jgi:hypothetical protein
MTGSARQRPWHHICLLVRGSIEIGSFLRARRSHAPLQDGTNPGPRQPNLGRVLFEDERLAGELGAGLQNLSPQPLTLAPWSTGPCAPRRSHSDFASLTG